MENKLNKRGTAGKTERSLIENVLTDRSFSQYLDYLNIKPSDLAGSDKLTLDIGSGSDEAFSKEAKSRGIRVVSMAPHLKDIRNIDLLGFNFEKKIEELQDNKWQGKSVAGRAQQMPFPDNTFDNELALYSIPMWLPSSYHEFANSFSEIIRTLKPGARAYIFPIAEPQRKFVLSALDKISHLITYHFETFENRDDRLIIVKNK